MAKSPTEPVEQSKPATQSADEVTLTEFCTRISASDRRVELIGAFNHIETKAGRIKATEKEFLSRFDAFIKQPA